MSQERSNIAKCRDCQGTIVWMKTFKGKNIAVEPEDYDEDDEVYDKNKHTCHWNVCKERKEQS